MNRNLKPMDETEWKTIPYYSVWTVIDRFTHEIMFQDADVNRASLFVSKVLEQDDDAPIVLTKQAFCLVRHFHEGLPEEFREDARSYSVDQMCWHILLDHEEPEQAKNYEDIQVALFGKDPDDPIPW